MPTPEPKGSPQPKAIEREYEVVSRKFVLGAVGDVVTIALTDNQEKSLLESGAVKRAESRPSEAVKLKKEVKQNG